MKPALAILLALFVLEGVVLVLWPRRVKAILGGSPETTLRVIGVLELVVVIVVLFLVMASR